ncbi:MAG: BrnT family toxin [Bdellovibrionales bacterium]|nr:BrnT family toxin [Bdellovibrionales bacterium]
MSKHDCNFTEAAECFRDPQGIQLTDKEHSKTEERFYWIGQTLAGRVLTVRFTIRGSKIRIIGCAEWRQMKRIYYEKTKNK